MTNDDCLQVDLTTDELDRVSEGQNPSRVRWVIKVVTFSVRMIGRSFLRPVRNTETGAGRKKIHRERYGSTVCLRSEKQTIFTSWNTNWDGSVQNRWPSTVSSLCSYPVWLSTTRGSSVSINRKRSWSWSQRVFWSINKMTAEFSVEPVQTTEALRAKWKMFSQRSGFWVRSRWYLSWWKSFWASSSFFPSLKKLV